MIHMKSLFLVLLVNGSIHKERMYHQRRFTCQVKKMCQVLHVSRSGYYKWRNHTKSPKPISREHLTKEIHCIFLEPRCLYGSPKVTSVLRQKGKYISQKTVTRIIKEQGLQSKTIKKIKLLQIPNILIRYITICWIVNSR